MRPAVIICALLLVWGAVACTSQEERIAEHRSSAEEYFEAEQWNEAKIEFLNLLRLAPNDAAAHYGMADTLWELEEYPDAIWQYSESVRLDPTNMEWYLRHAQVEFAARRYDVAREAVDEVLRNEPENVDALLLRGGLNSVEGDVEALLDDVDRALVLDPGHKGALAVKAQALSRRGDFSGAEEYLRRLVDVDPTTDTHQALGRFLGFMQRPDEALPEFQAAIEMAEDQKRKTAARLVLVNFYLNQGNEEGVENEIMLARSEAPDDADLLLAVAQYYNARGESDRARELLEENVANQPDSIDPLLVLAQFEQRTQDLESALATIERALLVDADSERARLQKAEYLMDLSPDDPNQAGEAWGIVRAVLEENPNSILGLFTEGKFLFIEQKFDEAATRLRRVLDEQPSANAHLLLGSSYLATGQVELARSEFLQALQLDAQNTFARTQLAALYLQTGERELALQECNSALETLPGDARLLLVKADALIGLNRLHEARKALSEMRLPEDTTPQFSLQVARLYRSAEDVASARAILDKLLEENPEATEVMGELVLVEIQSRVPKQALESLDVWIEQMPDTAALYELRARVRLGFKRDGKPMYGEEAEADLKLSIEKDPSRIEPYMILANYYREQGRADEALVIYSQARQVNSEVAQVPFAMAMLLESMGRKGDAMEEYQVVLRLDQNQPLAKNNLAWLLADSENPSEEDLDRALELAQDAKEALPDNPSVADTLGWVMLKKDIPSAAISLFREAIEGYTPGHPLRGTVRYHVARAYEVSGERDRAISELKKALGEVPSFDERQQVEDMLKELQTN